MVRNGRIGRNNRITKCSVYDPVGLVGGYGRALAQLVRRNFPDYSVGVQLSLPLRNRVVEADYVRDALTVGEQEVRPRQLEKQVRVEIQNLLAGLEQARSALEAAEQERRYQEQALTAEVEKLAVGASTTFLVIQYQRDLAQAQSAEVAARAAYVKTLAALDRARGALLARHGITLH
ncbi:MAG: TolC family protein [Bryobacteraceae bacterium]